MNEIDFGMMMNRSFGIDYKLISPFWFEQLTKRDLTLDQKCILIKAFTEGNPSMCNQNYLIPNFYPEDLYRALCWAAERYEAWMEIWKNTALPYWGHDTRLTVIGHLVV